LSTMTLNEVGISSSEAIYRKNLTPLPGEVFLVKNGARKWRRKPLEMLWPIRVSSRQP